MAQLMKEAPVTAEIEKQKNILTPKIGENANTFISRIEDRYGIKPGTIQYNKEKGTVSIPEKTITAMEKFDHPTINVENNTLHASFPGVKDQINTSLETLKKGASETAGGYSSSGLKPQFVATVQETVGTKNAFTKEDVEAEATLTSKVGEFGMDMIPGKKMFDAVKKYLNAQTEEQKNAAIAALVVAGVFTAVDIGMIVGTGGASKAFTAMPMKGAEAVAERFAIQLAAKLTEGGASKVEARALAKTITKAIEKGGNDMKVMATKGAKGQISNTLEKSLVKRGFETPAAKTAAEKGADGLVQAAATERAKTAKILDELFHHGGIEGSKELSSVVLERIENKAEMVTDASGKATTKERSETKPAQVAENKEKIEFEVVEAKEKKKEEKV